MEICGALRNLVPSEQLKKRKKGVFRVFKIVQMLPNPAKHHMFVGFLFILYTRKKIEPITYYL